ncbi:MAG TPA: type VI secretion system baseplate subunit TssG [Caulobacteraceae bacterium]|jgi:type VI secretion system protein ImpH
MAPADGSPPDHLSHVRFLQDAKKDVARYGFLALVRGAEARAKNLPRVGRSRQPAQNVVDMAHAPALHFPGRTIEDIEFTPSGRVRIRSLFLGLTGPMGALPLHLSEYAFYERRQARSQPFGRFLDLLTDRMLQFFYRAWGDSQPAVHADRPGDDRFAGYLAALSGGMEGATEDGAFPARARLHYAGIFAGRRSAAALQDGLSHLLRTPVRLKEFIARWREVEPSDRTRLGVTGGFNQLGRDTVLGGRVRIAEDTFRVIIRTRDVDEYEAFLPGSTRHEVARAGLEALAPSHLDWELELEVPDSKAPPLRLDGKGRLGHTSWLGRLGTEDYRADARLRRRGRTATVH